VLRKGKSRHTPAKGADIVKADVSQSGEGWRDSRIIEALETSASMVYRVLEATGETLRGGMSRKKRRCLAVARMLTARRAKLMPWLVPTSKGGTLDPAVC